MVRVLCIHTQTWSPPAGENNTIIPYVRTKTRLVWVVLLRYGCDRSGVRNGAMGALYTAALLALSLLLHVSVAQEPTLKLLPESIQKPLGEGVYVSCTALVDDPELVTEMAWSGPNGEAIPNDDGTISTLDGSSGPGKLDLMIQKLREQDTGVYNCTATYAGNQKLWASLEVDSYMDIDFGDTPDHQTPIIGEESKIHCTPIAKPAPLVDWLKDLVPLKNDDNHIIQQDGVLIKNVTEADEGIYRCRARVLAMGSIEYRDIQVTVYIPPFIDNPPEDINGVEKESVTFHCGASGKPAPTYSWVNKDNEPLEDLDDYVVDSDKGILTIMALRPEHSGTYRCTAKSPAGEDFKTAVLRVLTKPKVEQFLNITQAVEKEAEMHCIATGDPAPEIIFQKETNDSPFQVGINQDDRIEVQQTTEDGRQVGILKIRGVSRSDDGLYSCTAKSEGGETLVWGHITVEFMPTFEEQSREEMWSWEQKPVNLTCLATSIPNATIQWYLHNKEIDANDPNLEVLSYGPLGVLRVNPIHQTYFGDYTCQATNSLGLAEWNLKLNEAHVPGPVSSAKVEKMTATTITWSIIDPMDDGGLAIQGYVVEYRPMDQTWNEAQSNFWTKGSSYTLDGLMPQETYVFRFAARSEAGDGEWGGEKSEEMPRRAAPEEPLIFNVDKGVTEIPYPNQYMLQWQVPLDNGEKINFFQIVYYQVHNVSGKWESAGTKTTREVEYPGPTTHTIESLRSNAYYRIELRAHNDIGFSTPSEAVIKTPNGPSTEETTEPGLGIGIIIAIVVIAVLVTAVVVDVACFFTKNAGLTATIVGKQSVKDKDKEAMLEDGQNASDDKHEGNGQMKPQKEEPKQEQQESDEKIKDSTEPTETTPMIQGQVLHKIQEADVNYQDVLQHHEKRRPCMQSPNDNVHPLDVWNSNNRSSYNMDPVCSESFFKKAKKEKSTSSTNMESNDVKFHSKRTIKQNGFGVNGLKDPVLDANDLIKSYDISPALEQSSSDDSIYAVPSPYQYTRGQAALKGYSCTEEKLKPPPPPPPRRNPNTSLTFGKWSRSQETLAEKEQSLPQLKHLNTINNSPSLYHRMVSQQVPACVEVTSQRQSPFSVSKSKEVQHQRTGSSSHVSSNMDALNWGTNNPYYLPSREALNQEQRPFMSASREALNWERNPDCLSASWEALVWGQSPYMSSSCEALNLKQIPYHKSVRREELNHGLRSLYHMSASKGELDQESEQEKSSNREAMNEGPRSPYYISARRDTTNEEAQNRKRNVQNLSNPTRSPSESSSSTLYQPLNASQTKDKTQIAYGVAPYDDLVGVSFANKKKTNTPDFTQKMKVSAISHPNTSVSLVTVNRKPTLQPKVNLESLNNPSIPLPPKPSEVPSSLSAAPNLEEKGKSLTTVTTVYFKDNQHQPSHTQSMDHLDGPINSSPTAGQICSFSPSTITSAKSLGSLTESSSSQRSYSQPTII